MAILVTRRTSLKQIALGATACVIPTFLDPRRSLPFSNESEPTPSEAELAAMDIIAERFMTRSEVPALSVAIARHGKFVYREAFGWADQSPWELAKPEGGERATPSNLFRIASVSKPITSVTIFTLIEKGRLKLDDFVFGRKRRARVRLRQQLF